MKKETIIKDVKTAGVVVAGMITMSACNNIKDVPLDNNEIAIVSHKTDSVVKQNHRYTLSQNVSDFCNKKIQNYRERNKYIAKRGAKQYISQHIKDSTRRSLLTEIVSHENITGGFEIGDDGRYMFIENILAEETVNTRFIREKYRWVNDLLLYLNNIYTEKQFLNSEFFKVLNNERLEKEFIANTEQIESLKTTIDMARKDGVSIYEKAWNKNVTELKQSKQR